MEIFYPVERLFANPRIFFAIANYLEGPDGETLKQSFYELMEYGFGEYEDPEEIEFMADEICFSNDVKKLIDAKISPIILDMSGVSYLCPGFCGSLVPIAKEAKKNQCIVTLVVMPDSAIDDMIRLCGIHHMINVRYSLAFGVSCYDAQKTKVPSEKIF